MLLSEGFLRLMGVEPQKFIKDDSDQIKYDSLLSYTYMLDLKISVENENYNINFSTNLLGYRDDKWNINSQKRKILLVGDSFSAGYGINKSNRFSDWVEAKLNSRSNSYSYEVYNAAVSGYNLDQIAKTADRVMDFIKPKILIIGINIDALERLNDPYVFFNGFSLKKSKLKYAKVYNDRLVIHTFQNSSLQFIEKHLLVNSALYNFFIEKLSFLKTNLYKANSEINTKLIEKVDSILSKIVTRTTAEDIEVIVLPIIQHNEDKKFNSKSIKYYEQIRSLCMRYNLLFIDILPKFKKELNNGNRFGLMMTPTGMKMQIKLRQRNYLMQ